AAAASADAELRAEARGELDRLIADSPREPSALRARAGCSIPMGDLEAAARDLTEALRLDPSAGAEVAGLAAEIATRSPALPAAVLVRSQALLAMGDRPGAVRALDAALADPAGRRDVDLLLARRSLAEGQGDGSLARDLLVQATQCARDGNHLLERLHREAMTRPDAAASGAAASAIARADYASAAAALRAEPPSARKAWVLERCGRTEEAAACLEELLGIDGAQPRYAGLLDRVVTRVLQERGPALMAEVVLELRQGPSEPIAAKAARQAAEGGAR
ncbi:MAG TPA: hypothetical protein VJV23_12695, partial [Candidatus Polarisedimenticolia bacterium]|nr:hypothetical protein [Candidatus Polarisedimenticolia bacterium]